MTTQTVDAHAIVRARNAYFSLLLALDHERSSEATSTERRHVTDFYLDQLETALNQLTIVPTLDERKENTPT